MDERQEAPRAAINASGRTASTPYVVSFAADHPYTASAMCCRSFTTVTVRCSTMVIPFRQTDSIDQ
jgi:hypothetical protein